MTSKKKMRVPIWENFIPFATTIFSSSLILFSSAETRNMVFPKSRLRVRAYCHDENTKSRRTWARRTWLAGHLSHFQLRGLLRPALDAFPQLARHQRRSRDAGHGFWD